MPRPLRRQPGQTADARSDPAQWQTTALPPEWCTFCKKNADEVGRLVDAPGGMKICDECLNLANGHGASAS